MANERVDEENEFNLEPLEENDIGEPIDYYDPHEHRNVKNSTTNLQTFIHFLKASIGTGILAMPVAFAHAGYICGLILIIFIGTIALHCMHILIGSMYELCQRRRTPHLSYSEAMTVGFQEGPSLFQYIAPIAAPVVDGFLVLYKFGKCCIYVVVIAENIKQFMDKYWIDFDKRVYMCMLLIPLLLVYSIRNRWFFVAFSIVASGLLFLGIGVIFYYICIDLPPISERMPFENISKWPIFFGITLFELESISVIWTIEEMIAPKEYTKPFGIMNMGTTLILVLLSALGFFGYWHYGDTAKGSVTLNIPQDAALAQHVKLLFAITFWISYALQGYAIVDIIWNKYLSKRVQNVERHMNYELLLRSVIVLLTFTCAILVPDLVCFVSLVGCFCLSILGLVFPALLQCCTQYSTGYGPYRVYLTKNILLIIFGVTGFIFGTFVSISQFINAENEAD